ncbi:MAG TPA: cytochrome c [Abditibacteriaceae bacterium]|jgi:mono/diheme cytochrome c family protein
MNLTSKRLLLGLPLAALMMGASGCNRRGEFSPVDMWNRSRFKPLEPVDFFPDGNSSRHLPPGTVARGQLRIDEHMYAGRKAGSGTAATHIVGSNQMMNPMTGNGGNASGTPRVVGRGDGVTRAVGDNGLGADATLARTFPFPVTRTVLARGEQQFNVYCSPCHSRSGDGRGMIVERGFSAPPSFHIDRLRQAPVGHYFDAITNGYGAMYSYASRVEPRDRWAIIAYIRLLQAKRVKSGDTSPQSDTPRTPLTSDQAGNAAARRGGAAAGTLPGSPRAGANPGGTANERANVTGRPELSKAEGRKVQPNLAQIDRAERGTNQ